MLSSTSPITRPRPPSQTRRPSNMPSPARMRTQSHTPARARPLSPDAPPPYSEEKPERHSLTEIDDMLNVAGSVVRNRERELDAAALASRSLLEENKLMFAKREALLARLPISPRTSLSHPAERLPANRSSSWSTCSDDSDMESGTPGRDVATPTPDSLEAHRIFTPTHSANNSVDMAPAARLVPTQAERIAALHAGLSSPPPARPPSSATRRVSVSPAAVNHLQDANSALLARVQELEEATAKAQSEGAARMRRLQAEAESLRARLGEAEKANEGLRTEAEREKEKRVRARSAGHRKPPTEPTPPMPEDFAPSATWRPEFRSLRGGVRPAVEPSRAATVRGSPARAVSTISPVTPGRTSVRPTRAQSNAVPPRHAVSPKHTPVKPSMLRHQRANSYAGLGKVPSLQAALDTRMVSTVVEEGTDAESSPKLPSLGLAGSPRIPSLGLAGSTSPKLSTLRINASPRAVTSPVAMSPSPTQLSAGVLPFPSLAAEEEVDMSPMSTRLLAQQLVAKINELQATNEEIQQQRDSLKEMLEHAQSEADDLKRVCERLEHEVEVERSASGSGGSGGEEEKRRPGLQLEIPDDLDEPGWTGSVRGRKKGGALLELAAELGAELPDDGNATDLDTNRPLVDLASELAASMAPDSKPSTPTSSTFGSLGVGHPNPRARQVSNTSKPGSTKRALGNRGMATRAKTNPRRIRKSLSSVVFGKSLPSPVSSPTTVQGDTTPYQDSPVTPARGTEDEGFVTPRSEFVTPKSEFPPRSELGSRSEFVTPSQQEVYLTPASTLRVPGGLTAISPMTEEPGSAFPREDSTMAQLRAALDPLFDGVVKGKDLFNGQDQPPTIVESKAIQRKRSNLRLVFSKDEPLEPWEVQIRDLYTRIQAMEDDPGMSSAGEDAFKGSRRARALGRLSMRRRHKADDGVSDYAADDSEIGGDGVARREEEKRGFELARKLQQKSMNTFLEALLFVQFAVVLVVFVYTAVRRGPKAVLGSKRR